METTAALPILRPLDPNPPPLGFWSKVGTMLSRFGACLATSAVASYESVDVDVRRELLTLPLMALTSIGPRHGKVRGKDRAGERPVIFIHGMGGHRGNFAPMSAWFRRQGRRRLYSVGLPRRGDVDAHADHLGRFIDEVLDANGMPDGQVDLVAHSRGGIVARFALNDLDTAGKVATLVTIGTPHEGTVTARYGRGRELDDLRPDSEVITRLRRQLPWTGPRLVCIYSSADPLVAPPEHAQVDGAINIELEGMSHCRLLLWPEGWRTAYDAVATSP